MFIAVGHGQSWLENSLVEQCQEDPALTRHNIPWKLLSWVSLQIYSYSCFPVEGFSLRNSSIFVVWILPSGWWCSKGKLMVLIPVSLQPSCPACPPRLHWSGLILSLPLRHILSFCTHSQLPLEELDHTQGFSVSGLSQLKFGSRL